METGAKVAKRAYQELNDIQVHLIARPDEIMRVVRVPEGLFYTLCIFVSLRWMPTCDELLPLPSSTAAQSMNGPCLLSEEDGP